MRLDNKAVLILAPNDTKEANGVKNKSKEIGNALKKMGYNPIDYQQFSSTKITVKTIIKQIINSNSKHLFIRSIGVLNILLFPFLLYARIQGKIIYLDMPTPRITAYHEVIKIKKNTRSKILYTIYHCINGPWSYWPYSRIIQYAREGNYFLIGNKRKTIIMGNGIDIERFSLREKNYTWPDKELNLIGVGNISFYHGYDRIIKAINEWNKSNSSFVIKFFIVGDGHEITNLKKMTHEYKLDGDIHFLGKLYGEELKQLYSKCHLAISSLGLHRINLYFSSVLKAREYCLIGIPFIASGFDPDFEFNTPFRIEVSSDDKTEDIISVFKKYELNSFFFVDQDIRNYAINNLSFSSKLKQIGF